MLDLPVVEGAGVGRGEAPGKGTGEERSSMAFKDKPVRMARGSICSTLKLSIYVFELDGRIHVYFPPQFYLGGLTESQMKVFDSK